MTWARIALCLVLPGYFSAACLVAQQAMPLPLATEGFKQLDRNAHGKVSRQEAAQLPMFDQWDANKDGVVSLGEVVAFYEKRRVGSPWQRPPFPAPTKKTPADFVPDAPFVGERNGS